MDKQFKLKKPCENCPFRNDEKAVELMPGRLEEIIEGLLLGVDNSFHCHKTVYRDDNRNHDENGDYKPVDVCHCPGAAAVARKFGRDTVVMQIATRMGFIENSHLDGAMSETIETKDLKIDKKKVHIYD